MRRQRSTAGAVREIISIHAPRAGCDGTAAPGTEQCRNFNPRTPCGVRRTSDNCDYYLTDISIHAPRAGCDHHRTRCAPSHCQFQSTHPVRGATMTQTGLPFDLVISIHAPRAGCDLLISDFAVFHMYFNPRTPCGVRRGYGRETVRHAIFQSTHPVRGATAEAAASGATARAFQSTHPVRGATASRASAATLLVISIHAPRAGCDDPHAQDLRQRQISIHAPRAGCDHEGGVTYADETKFQSTHPVRGATRFDCVGNPKIGISIHAPRAGCDERRGRGWPC